MDGWRATRKVAFSRSEGASRVTVSRGRSLFAILYAGALCVLTGGCGDRLRSVSPEELVAFQATEAAEPSVDMETIAQAKIPVGPYRVVAGDVLQVEIPRVLDSRSLPADAPGEGRATYNCRVDDEGRILLPVVGWCSVHGKSLVEIEAELVAQYYPRYTKVLFPIYVSVQQYKTHRVSIVGSVTRPGIYPLRHDQMSLVGLLMEAGGIADRGAAVIRLSHRDQRGTLLTASQSLWSPSRGRAEGWSSANTDHFRASPASLDASAVGSSQPIGMTHRQASDIPGNRGAAETLVLPVKGLNIPFADVALEDGDSVVVEAPREQFISVVGLVVRPGNMPCSPDARYTLIQAIAFAGGLDLITVPRYVSVYRLEPDGDVASLTIRLVDPKKPQQLTKELALMLKPGDVVSVEHTPRTRANVIFDRFFRTSLGLGVYLDPQDLWGGGSND